MFDKKKLNIAFLDISKAYDKHGEMLLFTVFGKMVL